MLKDRYSALSNMERRVFWIVLLMAVLLGIFASAVFDTLLDAPNLQYALVNAIPGSLSILSLVCAGLIFFGRAKQASWIILIGALTGLLVVSSQAEGYGFPSAFILLAITLFVPLQILKGKSALTALGVGIAGTIFIILLDTFWTGIRVPALAEDVIAARLASVVLGLMLVAAVIFQYRNLSIRPKLLILALGTGLVSIVVVASFLTYFTQRAFRQETQKALFSAAHHTVDEIDLYVDYNTYKLTADAQIPDIIDFLKASSEEQEATKADMLALLNALAQSDPINIGSYALLNRQGIDLVDTFTSDIGMDKSDRDYFLVPLTKGTTIVTPVRSSPGSLEKSFYIGTPIYDENGSILGVLRVRFRSSLLDDIIVKNNSFAGQASYGILLDEHNIVLSHGINPEWVSHTLVKPDQHTFNLLSVQARTSNFTIENIALGMPDFSQNLLALSRTNPFFSGMDAAWGEPVEVSVARSRRTLWKVAFVQPRAIALEAVTANRRIIVLITLITGIFVALAGFVVARSIIDPISSLAATAEQIAAGDLSSRAKVNTRDEINTLAEAFNHMTNRLKDTLSGLESRVAERTADLEMARLLSERRAQELQSISDVSRIISSEQKLETLLALITRLVSEKFDFYHVGIFLLDSTHQYAVLQAANSEGGQKMLARGHRLEAGQMGIVGNVARSGEPRITLDVGADAVYFDNPDLPSTRSEMALPLNVRGETIGVLDVQSTKPAAFTENDIKTLSILADQISIAIDNARLFGQNKQALDEVQSLYNQYLRQEWKTFIQNRLKIGYIQSMASGKPLEFRLESDEIKRTLQNGQIVVTGPNEKSLPSVSVPIKLRGQIIGVLNIKAPTKDRRWNQDEINLAQVISDRLALALDNARLLFESQRQTAKEQKIGEVTAKIGASINMRNVLQTAVEELGRALPGSEVVIQFQNNGKQE